VKYELENTTNQVPAADLFSIDIIFVSILWYMVQRKVVEFSIHNDSALAIIDYFIFSYTKLWSYALYHVALHCTTMLPVMLHCSVPQYAVPYLVILYYSILFHKIQGKLYPNNLVKESNTRIQRKTTYTYITHEDMANPS
jgi:hypothetical protein